MVDTMRCVCLQVFVFPNVCHASAHVWLDTLYTLSPNVDRLRTSNWIEIRIWRVVRRCDKRPNQATCVKDQHFSIEKATAFQQAVPAASASAECRVANRSTLAKVPKEEGHIPGQGAVFLVASVFSPSRADAPPLVDPALLANRCHSSRISKSTIRSSLLSFSTAAPAARPQSPPRSPHDSRRCAQPQPSLRQARDKRERQACTTKVEPRGSTCVCAHGCVCVYVFAMTVCDVCVCACVGCGVWGGLSVCALIKQTDSIIYTRAKGRKGCFPVHPFG